VGPQRAAIPPSFIFIQEIAMILSLESASLANRMAMWRRQIGQRHLLAVERGPRPFAVVSYRVQGRLVADRYIPLRRLTLVALFDHWLDDGRLATRLIGVAAGADSNGLEFGGVRRSRFEKDLRLAPTRGPVGARLDALDGEFFDFAISLERYLERCARHPYMPRARVPRLPTLKAGVGTDETSLVDLATLPKRQVIRLTTPERDLVGRIGPTMFDFVNTRFRVAD
jgi:hypothetical protein